MPCATVVQSAASRASASGAARPSRWWSSADAVIRPREIGRSVSLFPARTPTLPPATHTNSYALGAKDVLLVEPATPYADEQRAWIEWARALPSSGRRPIAIFATHYHPDHVGGLDVLAREVGVPVWAHAETAGRVGKEKIARQLI